MKKVLIALLALTLLVSMTLVAPAFAEEKTYNIIWVSCSTESEFWQYQQIGMENAAADLSEQLGIKVNFSVAGPANEAETEAYLRAFENAVASKPDAIISATQVPDMTIAIAGEAMNRGIVVNFTNCGLAADDAECYNQFYTTSSADIGDYAGAQMLEMLKGLGYTEGIIGMHFSNINPALQPRMDMFKAYVEANSSFQVLDCLYHANDLATAQANAENQISTYGDKLVGLYGANNISGDGIALAIAGANLADKIVSIGVDSDSQEIQALADGELDLIVVQDAYGQGYSAMKNAIETLVNGSNPETEQNVFVAPAGVTTANMNEPEFAALLDPTLLKR